MFVPTALCQPLWYPHRRRRSSYFDRNQCRHTIGKSEMERRVQSPGHSLVDPLHRFVRPLAFGRPSTMRQRVKLAEWLVYSTPPSLSRTTESRSLSSSDVQLSVYPICRYDWWQDDAPKKPTLRLEPERSCQLSTYSFDLQNPTLYGFVTYSVRAGLRPSPRPYALCEASNTNVSLVHIGDPVSRIPLVMGDLAQLAEVRGFGSGTSQSKPEEWHSIRVHHPMLGSL
ncbi:hypothetical protein C8Q78DRAFT_364965 [Trametes maxima]|nr:hypothetical protein C8Q78DRAFT_364965 [Trametes maxima]